MRSHTPSAEMFELDVVRDTYPQKRADALVLMSEHLLKTLDKGLLPLAAGDR